MRGHIRKRGENSWELRWYVGRGPDGKKRYKTKTVHSPRKSDAQKELNRVLAETARGSYVEPSKMMLAEYAQQWLAGIKGSVKPRTWDWYEMIMRVHIIPHLGHLSLSQLTPMYVQTAYRELRESGASASTVNGCHRVLRAALNQAVRWELLHRNPVVGVDKPRRSRREMEVLTSQQVGRLLEVARSRDTYPLYLAAVTTGLREGELLGLRWRDIDLARKTITVTGTLDRDAGRIDSPKTESSARTIPIPTELVEELRKMPRRSELVFTTPTGQPINRSNLHRQFKSLLKKAGLPSIRFHDLRHTHATLLLQAGVHPKIVQERLGHSSISMTMDIYSHVFPHMQSQASDQISEILNIRK